MKKGNTLVTFGVGQTYTSYSISNGKLMKNCVLVHGTRGVYVMNIPA